MAATLPRWTSTSLRLLERDPTALASWRARATDLLVDEAQDLDRAQLRMALLLAAPANQIFLVGDDDQPSFATRAYRSALVLSVPVADGLRASG